MFLPAPTVARQLSMRNSGGSPGAGAADDDKYSRQTMLFSFDFLGLFGLFRPLLLLLVLLESTCASGESTLPSSEFTFALARALCGPASTLFVRKLWELGPESTIVFCVEFGLEFGLELWHLEREPVLCAENPKQSAVTCVRALWCRLVVARGLRSEGKSATFCLSEPSLSKVRMAGEK
jgi:hypothetical protein